MRGQVTAALAMLAAVALLAGCTTEPVSQPPASASPTPTGSPPASVSITASPTAPSTADAPGAGTEYCRVLATDFLRVFDTSKNAAQVAKAERLVRRLHDLAPAQVADDWVVIRKAVHQLLIATRKGERLQQQAEAGTITDQELKRRSDKLRQRVQQLNDSEKNKRAGSHIRSHALHHCGVRLR